MKWKYIAQHFKWKCNVVIKHLNRMNHQKKKQYLFRFSILSLSTMSINNQNPYPAIWCQIERERGRDSASKNLSNSNLSHKTNLCWITGFNFLVTFVSNQIDWKFLFNSCSPHKIVSNVWNINTVWRRQWDMCRT